MYANFNNYIVTFFVGGTLMVSAFSFALIYFIFLNGNRRSQYDLEKQQLIKDHQARETTIRLEEHERTLAQISKEVHDNIGQVANMIRMHLHHMETLQPNDKISTSIERVSHLTDKLIRDANNISHSSNGDYIKDCGLHNIISDDLEHIKVSKKIDCFLDLIGKNTFLDTEEQLIIYRIAQEALNNILKHAKATRIYVTLNFGETTFLMRVQDNGIGFDQSEDHKFGTGLNNMQQRAKCLNADLEIVTLPAKGCSITLTIKRPEKNSLVIPDIS